MASPIIITGLYFGLMIALEQVFYQLTIKHIFTSFQNERISFSRILIHK